MNTSRGVTCRHSYGIGVSKLPLSILNSQPELAENKSGYSTNMTHMSTTSTQSLQEKRTLKNKSKISATNIKLLFNHGISKKQTPKTVHISNTKCYPAGYGDYDTAVDGTAKETDREQPPCKRSTTICKPRGGGSRSAGKIRTKTKQSTFVTI